MKSTKQIYDRITDIEHALAAGDQPEAKAEQFTDELAALEAIIETRIMYPVEFYLPQKGN